MKKLLILVGFFIVEFLIYLGSIDAGATVTLASMVVIPLTISLFVLEKFSKKLAFAIPISIVAFAIANIIHLNAIEAFLSEIMKPRERLNLSSTMNLFEFIHWYGGSFILVLFWILLALIRRRKKTAT